MFKYIKFLAAALTISASCFAQEAKTNYQDELYAFNSDTVKNKKGESLKEVIIISQQQKTIVKSGKANIKPLDLPQASMVIGKETIKQQQILRLSDAVRNAKQCFRKQSGRTGFKRIYV